MLENNIIERLLRAENRLALLEKLSLIRNTITPESGSGMPPSLIIDSFLVGNGDTTWTEKDLTDVSDILQLVEYIRTQNILELYRFSTGFGLIAEGNNVIHQVGDDTGPARHLLYGFDDVLAAGVPGVTTVRGGGTKDLPTQTKAGMIVGQWDGRGYDDAVGIHGENLPVASAIKIVFEAASDWTTTSHETLARVFMTPSGSTTMVEVLVINSDGSLENGNGDLYLTSADGVLTSVTSDAPLSGAGTAADHLVIDTASATQAGLLTVLVSDGDVITSGGEIVWN